MTPPTREELLRQLAELRAERDHHSEIARAFAAELGREQDRRQNLERELSLARSTGFLLSGAAAKAIRAWLASLRQKF